MKKKIMVALTAALTLTLAGCGSMASSGSGTLVVGVRDDIMGFGYLDSKTDNYYGFEIDLAKELAKDLGYADVEFVSVNPENRKDTLLEGKVDCLVAAYSVSDSRLENFDFSPTYYHDHAVVMVENSTLIQTINDVVGKNVGVLEGADTAPVFSKKLIAEGLITEEDTKGTVLIKYDSYSDLSIALEEGEVDAACMDGCIARAYMQSDRTILEGYLSDEDYGVATQKDSELSGRVSVAITDMLSNGTIDTLIDKWD